MSVYPPPPPSDPSGGYPPAPGGEPRKKKLSTGAVVGIGIAAAAVLIGLSASEWGAEFRSWMDR